MQLLHIKYIMTTKAHMPQNMVFPQLSINVSDIDACM